jgi:hypothetical protein
MHAEDQFNKSFHIVKSVYQALFQKGLCQVEKSLTYNSQNRVLGQAS